MSPLPAHQSDRKPRGFPGHVPTSSACLPRRIRLCGGMPAPQSACSGISLRVALSTDSPASGLPRSTAGHRTVSRSRRPHRLKGVANSAGGPDSRCRLPAEMTFVQALMDLVLPRFAGMADGPRQVHPPWSVASDSPAPAQSSPICPWGTVTHGKHILRVTILFSIWLHLLMYGENLFRRPV